MNKLSIAMLVGAMALCTGALADQAETQATQAKPKAKSCDELSGKEKDKCIQATPAGPVVMTTGEKKKGKSEIAKDRDRAKAGDPETQNASDQGSDMDVSGQPKQQPPVNEAQAAAATGNPPPAKKP